MIDKLIKHIASEPTQMSNIYDVMSVLNLSHSQIKRLLRSTYKLQKERTSNLIQYIPEGYLTPRYEDIKDALEFPINHKEHMFKYACISKQLPSIIEYKAYCGDINAPVFKGSDNSFYSIRRDIKPMLIDNDLIT